MVPRWAIPPATNEASAVNTPCPLLAVWVCGLTMLPASSPQSSEPVPGVDGPADLGGEGDRGHSIQPGGRFCSRGHGWGNARSIPPAGTSHRPTLDQPFPSRSAGRKALEFSSLARFKTASPGSVRFHRPLRAQGVLRKDYYVCQKLIQRRRSDPYFDANSRAVHSSSALPVICRSLGFRWPSLLLRRPFGSFGDLAFLIAPTRLPVIRLLFQRLVKRRKKKPQAAQERCGRIRRSHSQPQTRYLHLAPFSPYRPGTLLWPCPLWLARRTIDHRVHPTRPPMAFPHFRPPCLEGVEPTKGLLPSVASAEDKLPAGWPSSGGGAGPAPQPSGRWASKSRACERGRLRWRA